jgi:hypothetical protein
VTDIPNDSYDHYASGCACDNNTVRQLEIAAVYSAVREKEISTAI